MKLSALPKTQNVLRIVAVGAIGFLAGCGYLKNVRDDALDIGTASVGVVTPVAPGEEGTFGIGPIPPAFGLYAQATDFIQLGAIAKATGDLEWDRRGFGLTGDVRKKVGLLFLHDIYIKQYPFAVNAYKKPGSKLQGWRNHMDSLSVFSSNTSAKTLIYEPKASDEVTLANWTERPSLPYFHNGWQNWEIFSLEAAIPEPFLLHSGLYVRLGVDPSEVFDFALGLICLDLYSDNAFRFFGAVKHQ